MSPEESRMLALRAEIERDWQVITAKLAAARSMDPQEGPAQAAFVALALDHAYQAFESMILRVERVLGMPARAGEGWHRDLLIDAGMAIAGVRPPIYAVAAKEDWLELLRFRHFLRHAYEVPLDPGKLRKVLRHLEQAVDLTAPSIAALLTALR